jgi:chemotaxis protein MotB
MSSTRFTTWICILVSGLIISSCGTSKKLESANAQITDLNSQLTSQKAKQTESDKLIADLQKANEINSRDAADCRAAKEALRQKKEKLDKELAARGTTLDALIEKEEAAVRRFKEAGCEVEYKNGRYHVTVPDEFVFESGSASIKAKGREALNVVAQVMYDNPGVTTAIVGNTDSLPVKGNSDNWSLSTERANAVVRVLEYVYNINPKRLVAAGRSQFNPVGSNDTPENRARNRRIEIIINPHFDRIFELLED